MLNKPLLISITTQPIELCKLLKIANLVSGGGEAKIVITQGYVLLNGEVEYQKRKKIIDGDTIEFNGDFVKVVYQAQIKTASNKQQNSQAKKGTNHLVAKTRKSASSMIEKTKRKPISF